MLNPTPLVRISGHIMYYAVCYRYLKSLTQRRLNLIDGSISSY